jgi:hypothetical protein
MFCVAKQSPLSYPRTSDRSKLPRSAKSAVTPLAAGALKINSKEFKFNVEVLG